MEMKMPYRLARVRAAVCHHTEAVSEAKLLRQLRDHGKNVPDQRGVFLAQLRRGGNVRLRHHQKVLGRQRLDIIERKAELILIELFGRDFSRDNLTKNSVVHFLSPHFTLAAT